MDIGANLTENLPLPTVLTSLFAFLFGGFLLLI